MARLNDGQGVNDDYWDYSKPLPTKGNIELQYHGDKLYWKRLEIESLRQPLDLQIVERAVLTAARGF